MTELFGSMAGTTHNSRLLIPVIFLLAKCKHTAAFKVLRASNMSPVTGLARLQGRNLWCVHMGNFSPVDRDNSRNTTKMIEHKLVLFATVIAFWTLVTLLIKLIRILLK